MTFDSLGQTLCHSMASSKTGTAFVSYGGYDYMADESHPLEGKIALIFLDANAVQEFQGHLFSEQFSGQYTGQGYQREWKPNLSNPDDLVGELDAFFGYDFLAESKIALHCKVIQTLDSIEDYDFASTGATFIFGKMEEEVKTALAVTKIIERTAHGSMVVDLTNSSDHTLSQSSQSQVLICPPKRNTEDSHCTSSEVFFSIVLLCYLTDLTITIMTGQEDFIHGTVAKHWNLLKNPIDQNIAEPDQSWFLYDESDVGLTFRKRLRELKDNQKRVTDKFDRKFNPEGYDINHARSDYKIWLDSHVKQLRELQIEPVNQQVESLQKLIATWKTIRSTDVENEGEWIDLRESKYATSSKMDWKETRNALVEQYENRNHKFAGAEVKWGNQISEFTNFGGWDTNHKEGFLYNFSPFLWKYFRDLNLLHNALQHNEVTETKTPKHAAWVAPTNFLKFNRATHIPKIRYNFMLFNKDGGYTK